MSKQHRRCDLGPLPASANLAGFLSSLTGVVHVGEFLKPWSPVVQVIVVLILIRAARSDGAEAARHRAVALVVVDQGRVVRGHVGVVVCDLQTLKEGKFTTLRTDKK